MAGRTLSSTLALVAGASITLAVPTGAAHASPPGTKDVTAVLFEWRFASVAKECATTLGPAGYGFVQVSPPAEHMQGAQWWTSYQPVSYRIAGRLGDATAFRSMVDTCHAAGVKVVVDTVVNHMSAGSGTGTGGSSYSKYDCPGLYSSSDFDDCTSAISNYQDRWNVQHCELVDLADLDTGEEYVRSAIAGYMNTLLGYGVDGFRIDAAKHMAAADLADIKSRLSSPSVYWKEEAIHGSGEAVQPTEYTLMLAYPYGAPDINSGYEFSDTDAGPPNGGTVNACWQDGWKCQHAWPEILRMVAFRNAVRGEAVTNWWDNGGDAIAFGRGAKGFVAVNHESSGLSRMYQTSLPAGTYCDVQGNTSPGREFERPVHRDAGREHGSGDLRGQAQLLKVLSRDFRTLAVSLSLAIRSRGVGPARAAIARSRSPRP
ncbi:hypothetical protein QFZ49_001384 [Streptomyces turgidiscabies]|uniref:Alpha-amylase n=1 Tax=Streptomyces turgidiscabies TaxID=85558 RepID=A0ABU0RHL2_9ACTN|nr:hypothetical protein [Streptomyces turgidiscabies]